MDLSLSISLQMGMAAWEECGTHCYCTNGSLFAWIPVETTIREKQGVYYDALSEADGIANATPFVEFLLQAILDILIEIERDQIPTGKVSLHIQLFLDKLDNDELSAGEIMARMGLKNRPAFRKTYLQPALNSRLIEMTHPDKPNSKNQKYRKRRPEQQ